MVQNDAVKIELHELSVDVKGSSEGFSSRKEKVERRRAEWPPFPFELLIDPAIWQMREIGLLNMNLVSGFVRELWRIARAAGHVRQSFTECKSHSEATATVAAGSHH
jgi:hypothetical protein